jgi:hypothetical protein
MKKKEEVKGTVTMEEKYPLLQYQEKNGFTIESIAQQFSLPVTRYELLEQTMYRYLKQKNRITKGSELIIASATTGLVSIHEEYYLVKNADLTIEERIGNGFIVYINGRYKDNQRVFGEDNKLTLIDTLGGSNKMDFMTASKAFENPNVAIDFLAAAMFNSYSNNTSFEQIRSCLVTIIYELKNEGTPYQDFIINWSFRLMRNFELYYFERKEKLEFAKYVHNWLSSGSWNVSEDTKLKIPHPDNQFINELVKNIQNK